MFFIFQSILNRRGIFDEKASLDFLQYMNFIHCFHKRIFHPKKDSSRLIAKNTKLALLNFLWRLIYFASFDIFFNIEGPFLSSIPNFFKIHLKTKSKHGQVIHILAASPSPPQFMSKFRYAPTLKYFVNLWM